MAAGFEPRPVYEMSGSSALRRDGTCDGKDHDDDAPGTATASGIAAVPIGVAPGAATAPRIAAAPGGITSRAGGDDAARLVPQNRASQDNESGGEGSGRPNARALPATSLRLNFAGLDIGPAKA